MVGVSLYQHAIIQCEKYGKEECLKGFLILGHPESAERICFPTYFEDCQTIYEVDKQLDLLPFIVEVGFLGAINIKRLPEGDPSLPAIIPSLAPVLFS